MLSISLYLMPSFSMFVIAGASEFGKEGVEEEEGIDMVKTIIIAVCSAGAYFALVIALTAYFSYRLFMRRKRFAKSMGIHNRLCIISLFFFSLICMKYLPLDIKQATQINLCSCKQNIYLSLKNTI